MRINLNGEPRSVEPGSTLRDLVPAERGVAIALNGVVVPAGSWQSTPVSENDAVEVVTAHQGG
ncbi:sulfur carrier protein ThiS [Nocardioides massiliensis]|uniref:Sulfur carrier protein n=1 Tax=Nocardioides massiliensis TaxID=1325935 RepID=A0ABT9NUE3_9ACTN|nr:sulfur carrier protein ThiS [Nocardioides massiliensis]MDP9824048.1 sulfur carrier protein [Nocardioides massiliensis]